MQRRHFLKHAGMVTAGVCLGSLTSGMAKPAGPTGPLNVLILTADDMNWDSVGAFGCPVAGTTPNLDRLAKEGKRFTRAHMNIAVCMPSRFAMMTGMYPHRSGSEGFDFVRDEVQTLHETFQAKGYLTGVLGKAHHTECKANAYFDLRKDFRDLGLGRDPEKYYGYASDLFGRAKAEDKPFFFVVNSHDPHRPFHGSKQETYNRGMKDHLDERPAPSKVFTPKEVTVPDFLPDLPEVRLEMAEYYSSVRRCDDTLGRVLDALKEYGFADHTLVLFLSDHGISMPFAKTNCYLNSTKTPLIVRWPGVVRPGSVDKENLVCAIDFTATILDAAGMEPFAEMDGRSFLPLLTGKKGQGRELVFTEFFETSGRIRFTMKCVQDKRFGYIFNCWSNGEKAFRNEAQTGRTWEAMVEAGREDAAIQKRVDFYSYRVPEELYDLENDPDCLENLVHVRRYAKELERKRKQMREWMVQTHDYALTAFDSKEGKAYFMEAEDAHAARIKETIKAKRRDLIRNPEIQ